MNHPFQPVRRATRVALAAAALAAGGAAVAQDNVVKLSVTRIDNHSKTNGISGVGAPAGADAEVGDATTLTVVYERMFTPNIGAEIVLGIPPRIHARASGSVAYLGDDVLSADTVAPTAFVNYHFGSPGDTWRPYLGAGINYTRFVRARSTLSPDPHLGDSYGWALQGGVDYAITKDWGAFLSIARIDVKSNLVAAGNTVLTTKIDFRPWSYTAGVSYRF